MRAFIAALVLLVAAACRAAEPVAPSAQSTPDAPAPARGAPLPAPGAQQLADRLTLEVGSRSVTAEVADEPHERQTGLMHRSSLAADAGMLFVFPALHRGQFWMKNTLIPLSIAFLRSDGDGYAIVEILDMQPCASDPCDFYGPQEPYDAALEVNIGWFADAGVGGGDRVRVDGPRPTAAA